MKFVDSRIMNTVNKRFLKAKIRNVAYYWSNENLSTRRPQYLHVLRDIRKELNLIKNEDLEEEYQIFSKVDKIIPMKVKSEECGVVLEKLVILLKSNNQYE